MHNIEIQQKFSKTSPIHQKSLTPLSAIMKFRIPILTNVLNIYTPQPQQRIILKKHDITLSPWSKSMLPWEQQNTGMQKSPNQNHWSPNLSWMMIFVAKIFQLSKKKHQTHTNLLVPLNRLCWPRTYLISFSLKPRARLDSEIRFSPATWTCNV